MFKRSKIFGLSSGPHANNCKDSRKEPDFVTFPSRNLVDSQKSEKYRINISNPEFCAGTDYAVKQTSAVKQTLPVHKTMQYRSQPLFRNQHLFKH
ncbi:hypothetical protein JTE90_023041 [Oedothorax gibbosus]|uniref:Uncharacterized protein n=1 Tax=Oedothorax gibbosus TaxID=931172 RepID=A0AAV6V0S9_9ARAC|nr:hypothetical protein JTE90_023041 [Oedothorax gibbosus]